MLNYLVLDKPCRGSTFDPFLSSFLPEYSAKTLYANFAIHVKIAMIFFQESINVMCIA
jgi:hypothetical protein